MRDGYVDASRSVQIGMRGNPRTLDWRKPSEELGYEVISMDRYRAIGPDETMAIIDERIGDAPLYITFDLDCLDPHRGPRRSPTLEAGSRGLQDSTRSCGSCARCAGKNVIWAAMWVCLMPTKDHPNRITAHTAAAIMFEIVSLVAGRLPPVASPRPAAPRRWRVRMHLERAASNPWPTSRSHLPVWHGSPERWCTDASVQAGNRSRS